MTPTGALFAVPRRLRRACAALALAAFLPALAAAGEPIAITLTPYALDPEAFADSGATPVAAYGLRADAERFGGLSGLHIEGARAWALSDRGQWLTMTLDRAPDGRITAIRQAETGRLIGPGGAALRGRRVDAEALARDASGRFWVAFEQFHRVQAFDALSGPPQATAAQLPIAGLADNGGIEGLAIGPDGALIAIAEDPREDEVADAPIRGWRLQGGRATEFRIPRLRRFAATGADLGPDGRLYLLERRYSPLTGVRMRLRRFAPPTARRRDLGAGETLITLEGRHGVDNMEAVAVEARPDGRGLLATIVSDDNFNPLQRTVLIQLALP